MAVGNCADSHAFTGWQAHFHVARDKIGPHRFDARRLGLGHDDGAATGLAFAFAIEYRQPRVNLIQLSVRRNHAVFSNTAKVRPRLPLPT